MNIQSNRYTFIFAIIVCVACSVLLSAVSEGLRERQEINADLEVKKNILKAVRLKEPLHAKLKADELLKIYREKIEEEVVDKSGAIMPGRIPADIKDKEEGVYPLYVYKENGQIVSYAFPISGRGLWSTLYGYLALEADALTVRGITFYKHGETPGLGAEIEKDWFQQNFVGKTVYSIKDKRLTPIIVVKGKASDQFKGDDLKYHVDGITAATLTCAGVTEMMDRWVRIYDAYFNKIRKL